MSSWTSGFASAAYPVQVGPGAPRRSAWSRWRSPDAACRVAPGELSVSFVAHPGAGGAGFLVSFLAQLPGCPAPWVGSLRPAGLRPVASGNARCGQDGSGSDPWRNRSRNGEVCGSAKDTPVRGARKLASPAACRVLRLACVRRCQPCPGVSGGDTPVRGARRLARRGLPCRPHSPSACCCVSSPGGGQGGSRPTRSALIGRAPPLGALPQCSCYVRATS